MSASLSLASELGLAARADSTAALALATPGSFQSGSSNVRSAARPGERINARYKQSPMELRKVFMASAPALEKLADRLRPPRKSPETSDEAQFSQRACHHFRTPESMFQTN